MVDTSESGDRTINSLKRRRTDGEADQRVLTSEEGPQRNTNRYRYDHISVQDNAQVQLGDKIYHHHHYDRHEKSRKSTLALLLDSLAFDRMDARIRNVAAALPETCRWLTSHVEFVAWTGCISSIPCRSILWIKGKPGSGKSTVMKQTLSWAERNWPSEVIVSYFFNARSTYTLEKSSLGLYRSLLSQLIGRIPGGKVFYERTFARKVRSNRVEEWDEVEIQNFLIELVDLGVAPVINIFIDALDEGAEDDIRRLAGFLRRLTQNTTSVTQPLRICLSSRHYPHITIESAKTIILEDQLGHQQDIEVYMKSELFSENETQSLLLRSEMLKRAAGVFLWVVLVTSILNKAYDDGEGFEAMKKKLSGIPQDLNKVFDQILSKDHESLSKCVYLLRWVLLARVPLTAVELYAAVQHSDCETEDMIPTCPTSEGVQKWMIKNSRGLVEMNKVRNMNGLATVQFIHETVRDYLLGTNRIIGIQSTKDMAATTSTASHFDLSHMDLAEQCLIYLRRACEDVRSATGTPAEKATKVYHFFDYAGNNWWKHMRECMSSWTSAVQELAINHLYDDRTTVLKISSEILVEQEFIREELYEYPPLHFAVVCGLTQLISGIAIRGADIDSHNGQGISPLCLALDHGLTDVAHVLIRQGANCNASGGSFGSAILAASVTSDTDLLKALIDAGADLDVDDGEYGTPLSAAASRGYVDITRLLVGAGAKFNATDRNSGFMLLKAIVSGRTDAAEVLIAAGANVNTLDPCYGTALFAATTRGYLKLVRLLVDAGADVDRLDQGHGTALIEAVIKGHMEIVVALIDAGANVNISYRGDGERPEGYNALERAILHGHIELAGLLIKAGAHAKIYNEEVFHAVSVFLKEGHTEVVQAVIRSRLSGIKRRGPDGAVLRMAIRGGQSSMVRLLVCEGAQITLDELGRSVFDPLIKAWNHGNVEPLLEEDANLDDGSPPGDALVQAVRTIHNEVASSFVGIFAKADADDKNCDQLATSNILADAIVVERLIGSAANIDSYYNDKAREGSADLESVDMRKLLTNARAYTRKFVR